MGRWGHRKYEFNALALLVLTHTHRPLRGDVDIDLAIEVAKGTKAELSSLVHQTDMMAPQKARAFYKTEEYKEILTEDVEEQCALLDAGLGGMLFKKFRAKKDNGWDGEYRLIILAALMMRAGATIRRMILM
jgi:hypothetical protein